MRVLLGEQEALLPDLERIESTIAEAWRRRKRMRGFCCNEKPACGRWVLLDWVRGKYPASLDFTDLQVSLQGGDRRQTCGFGAQDARAQLQAREAGCLKDLTVAR